VIRVMVGISVRAGEYGHFYTHFDDPQSAMQTQTVIVAVLVSRLPPVSVGGGREWSEVTSVKPLHTRAGVNSKMLSSEKIHGILKYNFSNPNANQIDFHGKLGFTGTVFREFHGRYN